MKLSQLLRFFGRVQPAEPEQTRVIFRLETGEAFLVGTVDFDVAANAWTVNLVRANA